MNRSFHRTDRVAAQLRRELGTLVREAVAEHGLPSVSVSDVEVTRDLAHAKVFVAVLGADDEQIRATLEGLSRAAGYLRKLLGQRLHVRTVPQLHFHYDESFDRGARLSRLIDDAMSRERNGESGESD